MSKAAIYGRIQRVSAPRLWAGAAINGLSQIFFQTRTVTGLLFLAAFVAEDWRMAVLVVLGALAGAAAGWVLGADTAAVQAGRQSFCGALAGAATFAALGGQWQAYPIAVLAGAVCAPLTWLLTRIFASRPLRALSLPATTAPFCMVAVVLFLATKPLHVESSLRTVGATTVDVFAESLLTNISQVVLAGSPWAGALIVLGLFAAGWRVGLAAIVGSVVASGTALAVHADTQSIGNGLTGYSAVLTAIGLAAVFTAGKWSPWALAIVGAIGATLLTVLVHTLTVPPYTWPFVLVLWAMLVVVHFVPRLRRA